MRQLSIKKSSTKRLIKMKNQIVVEEGYDNKRYIIPPSTCQWNTALQLLRKVWVLDWLDHLSSLPYNKLYSYF